jgi:hypothetical protein
MGSGQTTARHYSRSEEGNVSRGVARARIRASAICVVFGVGVVDPVTLLGVQCFLTTVVVAAIYFPFRQGIRVDPRIALRYAEA